KDADGDGIIDRLETAPGGSISSFKDPNGAAYPKLWTMGASVGPKDLFVEINSFVAAPNTRYGSAAHPFPLPGQDLDHDGVVIDAAGHDHRPLPTTLTLVGDALFRAGVRVHYDIGPLENAGYRVNGVWYGFPNATPGDAIVAAYPNPSSYFISQGAEGGESIAEVPCAVDDAAELPCQFGDYPGTVGWKFEFQMVRDAIVNAATGQRRFNPLRNGFFHYLLYSHARGIAKSPFP